MELDQTSTNVQATDPNGAEINPVNDQEIVKTESDIELIKQEIDRLKNTNSRLLEESKKYKQQKKEVDLKLLEAEGKKDEIIQTLQKELEEKQAILSEQKEIEVSQTIASEVARQAEKYGCDDWDHLLMLGNTDLIDYDEETGQVRGIDNFFEDCLGNPRFKKFFVKLDKVKPSNSIPSMQSNTDWKINPAEKLYQLRKEKKFDEYNKLRSQLEKEGLLKN
jgi:nucleotide-binding universal stress UspA family protein